MHMFRMRARRFVRSFKYFGLNHWASSIVGRGFLERTLYRHSSDIEFTTSASFSDFPSRPWNSFRRWCFFLISPRRNRFGNNSIPVLIMPHGHLTDKKRTQISSRKRSSSGTDEREFRSGIGKRRRLRVGIDVTETERRSEFHRGQKMMNICAN